jgi:iron(III) transport system substrate-binding protein
MRSLAYNTDLVPKAAAPHSYEDLLDPRWKGKMAWNPNSTSGALGFIATVLETMGEDKGMAYLRALARQDIIPVPMAIRAILDRVIASEYPIGLEMNPIHAAISAARGAPVRWVPLEPVTAELQVAGITAGAAHPNAARLFLDFMISRAGQDVFRDAGYLPMRPDVPAKETALQIPQGSFKTLVHKPEDVDANSRRWAKIYEDLFR